MVEEFQKPPEQLSKPRLREKLRNQAYLPTRDEIMRAFDWDIDPDPEWQKFCSDHRYPVFEFLNEEFITALSSYFSERAKELEATKENPVIILEVAAGNGRLSHFLQEKLDAAALGLCKVVPTDSQQWKLETSFPVEHLNYKDALTKYNPQIVMVSWMPGGQDFTRDFRAAPSVQEYVLIGETAGSCGDEWETWGIDTDALSDGGDWRTPPYVEDGFESQTLEDIRDTQICRTDHGKVLNHSSTVSFRRKK